jgi:hypothetical protein
MEIFKPCFDSYEISNTGNVRRVMNNNTYKSIKGSVGNRGYRYFQLQRSNKRINYLIHHLVAETFIGERPEGLVIDHIDRNKLNNTVSNLRYITYKENSKNSDRYRADIDEIDKQKRINIMSSESYYKKTGGPKIRKRGTGQVCKTEWGTYRAVIIINKTRYQKNLRTAALAEQWLIDVRNVVEFMECFEIM